MRSRFTTSSEEKDLLAMKLCRGSLLVALPSLLDSNFRRTILFLNHHDTEDGAIAFILNRPRSETLGDLAAAPSGMDQVPVFEGGPVERQNLILTSLIWDQEGAHLHSLMAEDLGEKAHPADLRAFKGYAGWSAGQLEYEILEKSWVVLPATRKLLSPILTVEEGISRWKSIMKELGPLYHLLSEAPDDPKLN